MVALTGACGSQLRQNQPGKVSQSWAMYPQPAHLGQGDRAAAVDRQLLAHPAVPGAGLVRLFLPERGDRQRSLA